MLYFRCEFGGVRTMLLMLCFPALYEVAICQELDTYLQVSIGKLFKAYSSYQSEDPKILESKFEAHCQRLSHLFLCCRP
jgi:hypothetical protein